MRLRVRVFFVKGLGTRLECPRLFFRPCVSPPIAALSFTKMDRPISDEANLLLELHPVRAKWRDLGIALKMKQADLDAIEKDTSGSVDRALQNMLTQWLKSDEDCTWSQIAEALDSAVVSEKKMAKSLRGKYCADYVLESERTANNGGGGSGQVCSTITLPSLALHRFLPVSDLVKVKNSLTIIANHHLM